MSADNWRPCPRCKATDEAAAVKRLQEAEAAYGIVPAERYHALLVAAQVPIAHEERLREDYEIGIDEDGEFSIDYGAGCDRCGFTFTFQHTQKALLP